MMNKIDIYFNLILILFIWLGWLIGINLIDSNQVVYVYQVQSYKILLSSKNIFYIFPIAFTIFIIYNFILNLLNFNKKALDIINILLFIFNLIILSYLVFINY